MTRLWQNMEIGRWSGIRGECHRFYNSRNEWLRVWRIFQSHIKIKVKVQSFCSHPASPVNTSFSNLLLASGFFSHGRSVSRAGAGYSETLADAGSSPNDNINIVLIMCVLIINMCVLKPQANELENGRNFTRSKVWCFLQSQPDISCQSKCGR